MLPDGVISSSKVYIYKDSNGLFCLKTNLDDLGQEGNLAHGGLSASSPPAAEVARVYYKFDSVMDQALEDFKGESDQRYGFIMVVCLMINEFIYIKRVQSCKLFCIFLV